MNEERRVAKQQGQESPIWDSIDQTHVCYNTNLRLVLTALEPQDRILVGSHNVESVEIAKKII